MNMKFSSKMSVKEAIDTEPVLIKMFMELKLNCIGCPMDEFHTLEDVAKENNIELERLLDRIQENLNNKDRNQ